jgi:DNA-binding transcriptional MerR regulator
MQGTFLQSEVIAMTGIKPRVLQFWTANDVLKATTPGAKAGSGIHRRYTASEVEIAAILAELERYGITIATLRGLGSWIRDIQSWGKKFGVVGADATELFLREQWYLRLKEKDPDRIVSIIKNKSSQSSDLEALNLEHLEAFPRGKPTITEEQHDKIWTWIEYERARKPRWDEGEKIAIYLAYDGSGKWVGQIQAEGNTDWSRPLEAKYSQYDSYLVVRLSHIFAKLWNVSAADPERISG